MPNWCSTSYVVTGDKKEVRDLYEKMKSLEEREKPLVENDFGVTWLGNLVTLLGRSWKEVYCRGEWSGLIVDIEDNELRFYTMTAWSELQQLRHFLQEKYPSLTFYFRSEEPGMCISKPTTQAVYISPNATRWNTGMKKTSIAWTWKRFLMWFPTLRELPCEPLKR